MSTGDNTDGNGIALDQYSHNDINLCSDGYPNCPYNGATLVMGNLTYFNGGAGILAGTTGNTSVFAIVNNTMYDNYWNVGNYIHPVSGNFSWFRAQRGLVYNNIMQSAPLTNTCYEGTGGGSGLGTPTGTLACSLYVYGGDTNVFQTNAAYFGPVSFDPAGTDTFPTTGTNHNLNGSDPLLTSVTPSSQANNFALQGGSPAIGFGQAFDLWQQSGTVDAGACPFSSPGPVVHCP
jgi:hypothetical protein